MGNRLARSLADALGTSKVSRTNKAAGNERRSIPVQMWDGETPRAMQFARDWKYEIKPVDSDKKVLEKALEIGQEAVTANPTNAASTANLSAIYQKLGDISLEMGDTAAARHYYDDDLKMLEAFVAADPTNAEMQATLAGNYGNRGYIEQREEQYLTAIEWYEKGIALLRKLNVAGNLSAQRMKWIDNLEKNLADCKAQLRKPKEAE